MKISLLVCGALLVASAGIGAAQETPRFPENAAPTAGAIAASRVVRIDEGALATLPALLGRNGGPGAISLRVSQEAFEANADAQKALVSWVSDGGTVFLHTGAARVFGFRTVAARLGTNALAGQLYGRARAALPFGANPLLAGDAKTGDAETGDAETGTRRAPGADPTLFPGVNVVFYELREGDHLVQSHPAGTPLLEVRDLATDNRTPLYAAALAPFGRGFAVFTPDFIDQKRGDGALFARNLLGLLASGANFPNAAANNAQLVGVASGAIEEGGRAPAALQKILAAAGAGADSSPALPAFGTAPLNPPEVPNGGAMATGAGALAGGVLATGVFPDNVRAAAVVLMTRGEAAAWARSIEAGGDRAGAAINLLRARLFLGRGEAENAALALEASAAFSPDSAEIALWRGVLQVAAAQNIAQPAPLRAQLVQNGARDIAQAAAGVSLLDAGANTGANTGGAGAAVAGISRAALRNWSVKLGQIAQIFALEPPLVERYGTGSGAITIRAFERDESLLLILPGVQALALARNFGWHGDDEEILVFPTPESYFNHRRALGLDGPTASLPQGALGDVVGQRISLVARLATPTLNLNALTGATPLLARLQSLVLLGAHDQSLRSPAWLQLGLENLANIAMVGEAQAIVNNQTLEPVAQLGGLLTPDQFRTVALNGRPEQVAIAQAQATALISFLYRTYGAGAATETVQRLGAGQSIDEALQATTGSNQLALFQLWREAQFGPRRFPNRG